jgi:hypothetical protein
VEDVIVAAHNRDVIQINTSARISRTTTALDINDGDVSVTTLPHSFKRIRLNLARSKEFPDGSPQHGYAFVAPLDNKGHIDVGQWREHRENCRVRRFWAGEDDEMGFLVHKPGGPEHARWVFDYDETADDDDESGYRFGVHAFRPGEYVSIRNDDGDMHTYQVTDVGPVV